ncbi:MAG: hypothetical protein IPO90_10510 [Flavobacteriales bacterium]|nr:hypothetical protein [Flavobacteriales bacterium]
MQARIATLHDVQGAVLGRLYRPVDRSGGGNEVASYSQREQVLAGLIAIPPDRSDIKETVSHGP